MLVNDMKKQLRYVKKTVQELDEEVCIKCVPQKPTIRSKMEGPMYRGVARNGKTGWQIICRLR